MNRILIPLLLKPLCKIGIHNYEIAQYVDKKGKHLCFRRSCSRCEKEQELKRPEKYHPSKWVWVSLLLIVLVGCSKNRVITQKDFNTKTPCVCNFNYIQYGNGIWFQDSCNKYNIGDTIK